MFYSLIWRCLIVKHSLLQASSTEEKVYTFAPLSDLSDFFFEYPPHETTRSFSDFTRMNVMNASAMTTENATNKIFFVLSNKEYYH